MVVVEISYTWLVSTTMMNKIAHMVNGNVDPYGFSTIDFAPYDKNNESHNQYCNYRVLL